MAAAITVECDEDVVTTVCGSFGNKNGNLREAEFSRITDIALDNHDIIVADDYRIRVVDTKHGVVKTITGKPSKQLSENADGTLKEAQFSTVWALCVDSQGRIFVLDSLFSLRKIDREEGLVSTLLEKEKKPFGSFGSLCGMVLDKARNVIYVGDSLYTKIYRISLDSNGNLTEVHLVAQLAADAMALDLFGNLYVCNHQSQSIHKIEADTGHITLVFQSQLLPANQVTEKDFPGHLYPCRLAVDSRGNILFTDSTWATLHQLDPQGNVSLLAGKPTSPRCRVAYKDGPALQAKFDTPSAVALDEDDIFVVDSANNCIRKLARSKKSRVSSLIRKWFQLLLEDKYFCDVEIPITNNFSLLAHRIVLFNRCPSFKKYLIQDSTKYICSLVDSECSHLSQDAWIKFIDYIYTESVTVADLTNSILQDLIVLGQTFLMLRLVNLMDQYMQRNLTLNNCVEWLVIAKNLSLKCSVSAMSLIQQNITEGDVSSREALLGQIATIFSQRPNEKILKELLCALFDKTKFHEENLFGTVSKGKVSGQETSLIELISCLHFPATASKEIHNDVDCVIEFPELDLTFKCHKCILATRSEYFGGLFHGQFMESTQAVLKLKIKDILLWASDEDAIKESVTGIMNYIYLGELDNIRADNYLLLVQLWKYFQLGELDSQLKFWIAGSQLTKDNVQMILETARGLCLPELEARCQRFLTKPSHPKRLDNHKLKQ